MIPETYTQSAVVATCEILKEWFTPGMKIRKVISS